MSSELNCCFLATVHYVTFVRTSQIVYSSVVSMKIKYGLVAYAALRSPCPQTNNWTIICSTVTYLARQLANLFHYADFFKNLI